MSFYSGDFIPNQDPESCINVDLNDLSAIYQYLISNVYQQDRYCQDVATIVYNHARGITSRNFVCGPSGSGKTFAFECVKKIFPRTLILNAASLTKDGWRGGNKVTGFLKNIDPMHPDYIIIWDEFDKAATPQYSSHGDNTSEAIQSEFLKLLDGETVMLKKDDREVPVDTSKMSFIFCGSFNRQAEIIAKRESRHTFGFGTETSVCEKYSRELDLNDILEAGVLNELVSRVVRVSNVRPLTLEDYKHLLKDFVGSPVKQLEERNQIKLNISDEKLDEIAAEAFHSKLGVRNATAQIQRLIDLQMFESFQKNHKRPDSIDL